MGMSTGGGDSSFTSEINITPLVDVVLVLLIIFMVIVPAMMRGYDVDIPGEAALTAAMQPEKRVEQVIMHIELAGCPLSGPPAGPGPPPGCIVRLNEEPVEVERLAAQITETFGEREPQDRVLFLAAEDELNYEGVMRILDIAKSGAEGLRIGLVTDHG